MLTIILFDNFFLLHTWIDLEQLYILLLVCLASGQQIGIQTLGQSYAPYGSPGCHITVSRSKGEQVWQKYEHI